MQKKKRKKETKMRMNNALFLNYAGFLIICTPLNNLFNKLIKITFLPPFKGGCILPVLASIFCLRQLNEQPDRIEDGFRRPA